MVVVANLQNYRKKWAWISSTLVREGAYSHTTGNLFKGVVKAVLLFWLYTWIVNPIVGHMLGGFHHRLDLRLIGKKPRR